MATNYPGAVDSFTNPAAGDALNSPSHAAQHANANDAIEAIETELGTTPSGSESTVAARLDKIEDGTRLGTGSVGATQLADNAVDTAAIANSAVTSAKIADGTITATDVAADTFAAFGTVGNLLTANQATGTDAATFAPTNATQSGATFTATATAAMSAQYANFPATPGDTYTAFAKLTATGRANAISLNFRDSGGTQLANLVSSPVAAGTSGEVSAMAVAPAGTATVRVYLLSGGYTGNIGDTVAFTKVGLWRGAAGTWSLPGTPIVGQSHIATNGAVHLSGTGTPEGVVTAAPGSTFLQTDSTVDVKGWIKWIKATGTGNTGWVAGPEADTGWRDVTASLINSWSGALRMRRVGARVIVAAEYVDAGPELVGTSASAASFIAAPAGFRPGKLGSGLGGPYRPLGVAVTSAGVLKTVSANVSNGLQLPTGASYAFEVSYLTADGWPSSLPGTAA